LYAGSYAEADDRLRLGRMTDWRGGEGAPLRALGQRMFQLDEDDRAILEIQTVTIASVG
jgi:protein involved in temperature-dependent protein secretion